MFKRLLSVVLTLCMMVSIAAVGTVSSSAKETEVVQTGNIILETITEQLIDDGMRAICMGMDAVGEATGEEGIQEAFSIIERWCFMDATEVAVEELMELCQEILDEIKALEDQVDSNDTYITSMIANESIRNARNNLDNKWKSDVTACLTNANVVNVLDQYKVFLSDAVNKKAEDVLNQDKDNLIHSYEGMASGSTSIFDSNAVNNTFISLLSNLELGLSPQSAASQSISDYAAQLAYLCYPFSHQQYQYVHAVMEQQIMTILLVEMAYNEFLYNQGEYLKETYHDEDDPNGHYAKYLGYQKDFYNKMLNGIVPGIKKMLDHKMNVNGNGSISLSLSDYMKPEDAVSTTLKINNYSGSFNARYDWCLKMCGGDEDDADDMYDYYEDMDDNISNAKYIGQYVKFKKVMTHTANGRKVYYILDPDQFKGTDALYAKNFDHNCVFGGWGHDTHTISCDAHNLMKQMTDNSNNFIGVTDKDCTGFNDLVNSNYFSSTGSTLQGYLGANAERYLPDKTTNPCSEKEPKDPHNFVLTSVYHYEENAFKTEYATYSLIDCNKTFPDEKLHADYDMYMKNYQSSTNETFTVILRNESNTYKSNAHAVISNPSSGKIELSADDVHYDTNIAAAAGTQITVRMMAYKDAKFASLKMIRDADPFNNTSGDKTETLLMDSDQLNSLTPDGEGYITAHFTMPYSDATFRLEMYTTARIGETDHISGNLYGYDPVAKKKVSAPLITADKGTEIEIHLTADAGYEITDSLSFYNDDTNTKVDIPYDHLSTISGGAGSTTTYKYRFIMPEYSVRIEARAQDKSKAQIGNLAYCTGTMGTADLYNIYGIVEDTHETSIGASAGDRLGAIIRPEDGYGLGPNSVTFRDTGSGEALDIKYSTSVKTDTDGTMLFYVVFTMPQNSVTIDVTCEPCLVMSIDPYTFAYDENNNPVSYIRLLDSNFRETDSTYVQIPSNSTYYIFYLYDVEEHYLSHFKMVGTQTGKVYLDQDMSWDMDRCHEYLADNVGDIGFANNRDKRTNKHINYEVSIMFGTNSNQQPISESMMFIPTFANNEKPEPTEPPTEAPTEPPTEAPAKYTATLSSFDGGTPTFTLGSVAVTKKAEASEEIPFYITASPDYEVKELTITGTSGTSITPQKTAEPYQDGENMIHSYSFTMPAENVVIKGKLGPKAVPTEPPTEAPRYFAVPDNTQFIRDGHGEEIAYIELKDPETNDYTEERIWFASDTNTIEGRFVYNDEYCPSHLKVVGKETGTVYYDNDKSEDANTFVCMTSDLAPYGENLTVIPTFKKAKQPTEPPTEAPTIAPTEPSTEPPTEKPTDPEPVEHGIRNYDELVAFAQSVNSGDNSADAYLENNILVPADSEWTQGIGTEDNPYSGTFNGNGYCIIGLKINSETYGGLFAYVGDKGVVKDLMVFDTRFKSDSEYAAGIAVKNEGTIDHCISGINVLGKTRITLPTGKKINPADYNSVIRGDVSGGIAAINKGTITGCRNGSVVTGVNCGGIACENSGSIYGSTNNGAIGTDTADCQGAGGIAYLNSGSIASSYNSGKIHCGDAKKKGMITAISGSDDVNDVFFSNVNSIPPIGDQPDQKPLNDSNKLVDNPDMLTPSFVETLAAVTDETVTWVQTKYGDTYFNQGYPTIRGRFLEQNTQYLTKEITITGAMHSSLKASAAALDTESDEYKALSASADGEILSAYSVATTDANGKYVPAELWISGSVRLTVPIDNGPASTGADGDTQSGSAGDVVLAVLDDEGEVAIVTPDSTADGKAVFTLAAPKNFAVVMRSAILYGDTDLDGSVTIVDATLIQRYLANLDTLSDRQKLVADVDGDGDVTIIDASLIQRKLAGIIKVFPAEESKG